MGRGASKSLTAAEHAQRAKAHSEFHEAVVTAKIVAGECDGWRATVLYYIALHRASERLRTLDNRLNLSSIQPRREAIESLISEDALAKLDTLENISRDSRYNSGIERLQFIEAQRVFGEFVASLTAKAQTAT